MRKLILLVTLGLLCGLPEVGIAGNPTKQKRLNQLGFYKSKPSSKSRSWAKRQVPVDEAPRIKRRARLGRTRAATARPSHDKGYRRIAASLLLRVSERGYVKAAAELIETMVGAGLDTDELVKTSQERESYSSRYLHERLEGRENWSAGKGSLKARLQRRAARIRKLAQEIDAPLYTRFEADFLRDVEGARVLMIGRGTEGFYHWIHSALRSNGASRKRLAEFDQVDISGDVIEPALGRGLYAGRAARHRPGIYQGIRVLLGQMGISARAILESNRRLVLLDTGRFGTIPREVKSALLAEIALNGSESDLRKLDSLIEVRLLWSTAQEGAARSESARFTDRQPALTRENFFQVIAHRTAPGYIEGEPNPAARNPLFLIDERPRLMDKTIKMLNRDGRAVLARERATSGDYYGELSKGGRKAQEQLRKLDAMLFNMALMDLRSEQ